MAKLTSMNIAINFMIDLNSLSEAVGVPCDDKFKMVVRDFIEQQIEFEIDQSMGSYFDDDLYNENNLAILKDEYEAG